MSPGLVQGLQPLIKSARKNHLEVHYKYTAPLCILDEIHVRRISLDFSENSQPRSVWKVSFILPSDERSVRKFSFKLSKKKIGSSLPYPNLGNFLRQPKKRLQKKCQYFSKYIVIFVKNQGMEDDHKAKRAEIVCSLRSNFISRLNTSIGTNEG